MKKNTKQILKYVGVAFLAIVVCMGSLSIYNKINDKDLNPDNLLKYEEHYNDKLTDEWENGTLKAKWNDNGSFALYGKYEDPDIADSDFFSYDFATVSLAAGTYTFSHGNDNCSDETYYLSVKSADGTVSGVVCDKAFTFELTEASNITISFNVKNEHRIIYAKFEPVLVAGEKAGDFFVED